MMTYEWFRTMHGPHFPSRIVFPGPPARKFKLSLSLYIYIYIYIYCWPRIVFTGPSQIRAPAGVNACARARRAMARPGPGLSPRGETGPDGPLAGRSRRGRPFRPHRVAQNIFEA